MKKVTKLIRALYNKIVPQNLNYNKTSGLISEVKEVLNSKDHFSVSKNVLRVRLKTTEKDLRTILKHAQCKLLEDNKNILETNSSFIFYRLAISNKRISF